MNLPKDVVLSDKDKKDMEDIMDTLTPEKAFIFGYYYGDRYGSEKAYEKALNIITKKNDK